MAPEEAPVKVSDSAEGLLADKRGVNSSVSLSLQGAGMTDCQRLEGYRLQDRTSPNWGVSEVAVIANVLPSCEFSHLLLFLNSRSVSLTQYEYYLEEIREADVMCFVTTA